MFLMYPLLTALMIVVHQSDGLALCSPLSFTRGSVTAFGRNRLTPTWSRTTPRLSASTKTGGAGGSVLSSSLLIAGTTIGGGFLALPRATAPAGFFPSTLGLVLCWFYLMSSAFALADATIITSELEKNSDDGNISIFRVCSAAFGESSARIAGLLFAVLMVSTLVAQLSKSGTLLSDLLGSEKLAPRCTLLFSALMAMLTFGGGAGVAERVNSWLTATMLLAFGAVVFSASRVGDYTRLVRAHWSALIPSASDKWSIPVLLQLLVYAETIPYIVKRLGGDRRKIRQSIAVGSFVPLVMCIAWTGAALSAAPFDPLTRTLFDPVNSLVARGASSQSLRSSILTLAASAISTTVIGTLLASTNFLEDVFRVDSNALPRKQALTRLALRCIALFPCALLSAYGSRELYYAATAFAGMFPVTALWGLFPPLAFLSLSRRVRQGKLNGKMHLSHTLAMLNVVVSIFLLAFNLFAAATAAATRSL